jgi:two-component system LytT family response regulator
MIMPYSVIIADDEPLARQVIRDYLASYSDFRIVRECDNGRDAVDAILSLRPDAVFLDIQMPELNGIEVIENLDRLPHVVFSTAYDEYAIKAFELNALDYLLKPYDARRFGKTMEKLSRELRQGIPDSEKIEALIAMHRAPGYPERILVPHKNQLVFIQIKDVLYIEAVENYVSLVTSSETYLLLQRLSDIEKKLSPGDFFLIHRSYIVNVRHVEKIETWMKGGFHAILKNGKSLPLSRRRVKEFKTRFGF